MTTVVLGWDGLDAELVREFGLADAFGEQVREIDTFDNPIAGEPLTREVWPSIISGVKPDDHGIHAMTDGDGIDWDNPLVNAASTVASGVIPHSVRTGIGSILRNCGARVQQTDSEVLDESLHGTVFDGRDSVALSIPGYRTELDRELGLEVDRTAIWNNVLHTIDTEEGTVYQPDVSIEELEMRLVGKARRRFGFVEAAADQNHDIVFCWFGYLDTVGHLEPAVGRDSWQRDHYQRAATWTRRLRDDTDADVMVVSDHGLQKGTHTHSATYAAPPHAPIPSSVLDVRDVLEAMAPAGGEKERGGIEGDLDSVDDQLEALGYV